MFLFKLCVSVCDVFVKLNVLCYLLLFWADDSSQGLCLHCYGSQARCQHSLKQTQQGVIQSQSETNEGMSTPTNSTFVPPSYCDSTGLSHDCNNDFMLFHVDCMGVKQRHKICAQKVLGCGARSYLHSLGQSQSGRVGHLSRRRNVGRGDI